MSNIYEAKIYILKALTNLHVGNGEVNYSVIDKQVQKDILTGYPTIHSSSIKGALKEYVIFKKACEGDVAGEESKAICKTIFGSDPTESKENEPQGTNANSDTNTPKHSRMQGVVNFFDAKILALPVRTDKFPYLLSTSKKVLKEYIDYCEAVNIAPPFSKNDVRALSLGYDAGNITSEIVVEDEAWKYNSASCLESIKPLIGDNIILLDDDHFDTIAKELPFVARNYLENGKSENLWYEEVVPRESLFFFALQKPTDSLLAYKARNIKTYPSDENVKKHLKKFEEITQDTKEFFLGANTSVGYGLCKLKELS